MRLHIQNHVQNQQNINSDLKCSSVCYQFVQVLCRIYGFDSISRRANVREKIWKATCLCMQKFPFELPSSQREKSISNGTQTCLVGDDMTFTQNKSI